MYGDSFGPRRTRLSITSRPTIQTWQTRWSGEASVTLVSPQTTDGDSITWVSLLPGKSWRTWQTGGTRGAHSTR